MGTTRTAQAADGHSVSIYVAEPPGAARGGLVVVQEIFGVNSHIRAVCDDFAGAGFLVAAPALFDRVQRDVGLGYESDDVAAGRALAQRVSLEQALADVAAAVDLVQAAGRVGLVGYCWGGSIAWAAATRLRTFAATVGYYGSKVAEMKGEQPNCPVMLHFGEHDHAIPLDGVEAVQAAHPEVPVYIYPAGHGFNCDQRASYDAESARLARERTLAFLSEHVG